MSRARVWTFITYPDSLPDNWKEIVEEQITVPFVTSPLHDKDKLEDSEEGKNEYHPYKKPHYHNLIMYDSVKDRKQVLEIAKLLGVNAVQRVHSTHSMIRYFVHMDQKHKAQYDKEKILVFNGSDINALFKVNDKEKYYIIKQIIEFIQDEEIEEFSDLMDYSILNEYTTWFPLLCDSTSALINNYITSVRHKKIRNGSLTENISERDSNENAGFTQDGEKIPF